MSLWDRIKNGNKPETPQKSTTDDFDYKAGYARVVTQLQTVNHNLIIATTALGTACEMAHALVSEAQHIEIECLEGKHDGHKECGFTVTHDALDAYNLAQVSWDLALMHIRESMGHIAYTEIKERIASSKTTEAQREKLELLLKAAEKAGK
jgi:hypothetical protein